MSVPRAAPTTWASLAEAAYSGRLDDQALARLAGEVRPKLMVVAARAQSRVFDIERLAAIAHLPGLSGD